MRERSRSYYADKGKYPESLDALATDKYLRKVPVDPITESAHHLAGGAARGSAERRRLRREERRAGQGARRQRILAHGEAPRRRASRYLTVLFVIAILLGGLALVGETWETSARREKEAELLFIGNEYRRAIGLYYASTPGAVKRYPSTLEDLIKDPRQPSTRRHMRRLYPDPMTGKEWVVVKGADGGVAGVQSLRRERRSRLAGFRVRDASFEGAQKYSDWKFIHTPPAAPAQPAAKPGAAQPGSAQPGAEPAANPAAPGAKPKSEVPSAMGFGTMSR